VRAEYFERILMIAINHWGYRVEGKLRLHDYSPRSGQLSSLLRYQGIVLGGAEFRQIQQRAGRGAVIVCR